MSTPAANISHTHVVDFDRWWKNLLRHIFAFHSVDPFDFDVAYNSTQEECITMISPGRETDGEDLLKLI